LAAETPVDADEPEQVLDRHEDRMPVAGSNIGAVHR
jgi:hypothetical protein